MPASAQYTENIIRTFKRAAEANCLTPGREGNMIALTEELAGEVMLTGDLHGNRRNFNMIRRTAALDANPRRHLVFQEACHGGPKYPHRGGCMSHALVEDIARLKTEYPERVHFLLGNHELAEMTDYPVQKNRQLLNAQFRAGMQYMYDSAADHVRQALLGFLRTCPIAVSLPHGVFMSHSLPQFVESRGFDKTVLTRPLDDVDFYDGGEVFRLTWGRDYRPENAQAFAEVVGARLLVNGHEPCPEGFAVPNPYQIILDCCGETSCYLILPADRELSQAEAVERIKSLS